MKGLKEIILRRMTPEQMADELVRVQKENTKLHEENLRLKVENFWLALGKPVPKDPEIGVKDEETKNRVPRPTRDRVRGTPEGTTDTASRPLL